MSYPLYSYPMLFGVGWVEGAKFIDLMSRPSFFSKNGVRLKSRTLLRYLTNRYCGVLGDIYLT